MGDCPKAGSYAYYQKEASSMKQVYLRDMLKQPPRVSVHQLLWYLLTSRLLLHQLLQLLSHQKTQRNTLMTLNQKLQEIYKWNFPLIGCTAQVLVQQQKIMC